MNYYKVQGKSQFYSALLKTETKEEAIKQYQKLISIVETQEELEELKDDMREFSLAEVIVELRRCRTEDDEPISDTEILEQLVDDDIVLLTADRTLM
ncbi:hypothetical protein [uncultured Vagococcus sp.]|uniref:hypothetical protein n=1 Tax=uncultured Vagococcus sp. TaxID=189676 RepID=UPI002589A00C|nr:hypothetical protein [uncultured Vagococcus sp.]